MSTQTTENPWQLIGHTHAYAYWARKDGEGIIYNVMPTNESAPAPTSGGYSNLMSLRSLKNDDLTQFWVSPTMKWHLVRATLIGGCFFDIGQVVRIQTVDGDQAYVALKQTSGWVSFKVLEPVPA